MNSIIVKHYPLFQMYQELRDHMMGVLSDEDLGFRLPDNPPLGALCQEIGQTEQSYIESFKTFTLEFSHRGPETAPSGVQRLSRWFSDLDRDLREAIEALTEDDVQNRLIDRGHNFKVKPFVQVMIYKEALLIFYGKSSVYLRTMGKTPSERWTHWIG